jgi:hypothetical protein
MNVNKLVVVAIAGAFALPLAAQVSAADDAMILAQGPSGASSVGTGPTGGTPSPQSAGEPKAATDNKADTKRCESMTGLERENCMRDARAPGGAAGGTTGSATSGATTSGSAVTPGGSDKTGTTAGPGEASPRTAPSSDTATSPSTSGTGKAQ